MKSERLSIEGRWGDIQKWCASLSEDGWHLTFWVGDRFTRVEARR